MVEKLKKFNANPPGWYKTLNLTLLTAFVGSILAVLVSMNGNMAGMDQRLLNQAKNDEKIIASFERYADKTDNRITDAENCIDDLKKVDVAHDFMIKDHDNRIKKLEDKG